MTRVIYLVGTLFVTRVKLYSIFAGRSGKKRCHIVKMSNKQAKNKSLTKEEELLLQDFSRNVSTKSSALFYGNALIVSAIPICKFTPGFKYVNKF
jgi:hypothetical protein